MIADRQAYAVIPPRKNAKPWKDQTLRSKQRNELLKTVKRPGKSQPLSDGCYEVKSGTEQQAGLQVDRGVGVEITGLKRS